MCWWTSELSGEAEYRYMIHVSVRTAWPLLMAAFLAAPLRHLWPTQATSWLLRNRKYVGLAFSAVMLWQILFIALLLTTGASIFPPGLAALFTVSDLVGYTLLLAMTVTSFDFARRRLSPSKWKRLHRVSLYYVWGIYLYSFPIGFYLSRNQPHRATFYALLFAATAAAGLIRIASWIKQRRLEPAYLGVGDDFG